MPDLLGGFEYTWPYYIGALAGYLLGSIPFGLLLTRLAGLGDIRTIGSGNIGATNVLRTGNKELAAATLLLDGGKGTAAVLVADALFGPDMAIFAGGGAILGHLFPVWLKFKGGKGVATTLGILLALAWPVGVLACLTWLAVALVFRISSLSALAATAASIGYAWWLGSRQEAQFALFLAVLVWISHRANIGRLLARTEPRIGRGGR
ncbi:MAG: glycerol-3-phosphate acyltransferase [Alphaproteobacteria bacterium]|nr:MAG: glycerol-3-phosphate acyltransferase [Alphaproteobacteria bacterium]